MIQNISRPDDRYFRTTSFNIAAFLFTKGFELANIDKLENPHKAHFVFPNSPELTMAVHVFNFAKEDSPELKVSARLLFTAIKQIKTALYQDTF